MLFDNVVLCDRLQDAKKSAPPVAREKVVKCDRPFDAKSAIGRRFARHP
ncbi:MAG: hypothetical protein ABI180_09785 [Microcoleus sp.]